MDHNVLSQGAEMGDEGPPMAGMPPHDQIAATLDQAQLDNFFKAMEAFSPRHFE